MIHKIDYKQLNKRLAGMYIDDAFAEIMKCLNKMIKEINDTVEILNNKEVK